MLVWALGLIAASSVYQYWSDARDESTRRQLETLSPVRGARCTIQLLPEAWGFASSAEQGAERDGGRIEGRFAAMNDRWIVLDGLEEGQPQFWVPQTLVRSLSVEP
jgi:hypothetical protein